MYSADDAAQFSCFDGSQMIPFSHINDDYCDCADASDEPGNHQMSQVILG